ncbi:MULTISPECIES: hypothetical protein [Cupriavidus]|uniref:Uncharacterized protein n=1 Tax=Cupriavidus pinatubonensis TaxID=248026 RepID=A0ABM8X1W5_9BURK|nr:MULTISPECIES: hypothetical protein [Cupriavidus]QYY27654.1 hypothetical protein K2O51_06795 [Cupriavidus pinatubonensis]CAG9173871.1 hypothetical protein LMG23994_02730 [Cupriavidus pinatubonensis]
MTSQRPASNEQDVSRQDHELDIPFGSLDAAAMVELPYTFRQAGTCTQYFREFFS